ncbi:MAG: S1 RNA-binding domain-containing protein, partial [Planctomycetota bacterium]
MSNDPQTESAETASATPTESSVAKEQPDTSPAEPAKQDSPVAAESKPPADKERVPAAKGAGPLAARGLGVAKPASPSVSTDQLEKPTAGGQKPKKKKKAPRPRLGGERESTPEESTETPVAKPAGPSRVMVPSVRGPLGDDLEAELEAELAAADVESMLGGQAGMPDRREPLAEGTRISCRVLKIHQDSVYVGLGGPDEGVVPFEQFEAEPQVGAMVEVMVRGFNGDDGLYLCTLPGAAIDVADWTDLEEGAVVEAVVTGHNTGGLECKVGTVRAFMPISQIAEYRVEDASEFVDQKFLCLVTEANERR